MRLVVVRAADGRYVRATEYEPGDVKLFFVEEKKRATRLTPLMGEFMVTWPTSVGKWRERPVGLCVEDA